MKYSIFKIYKNIIRKDNSSLHQSLIHSHLKESKVKGILYSFANRKRYHRIISIFVWAYCLLKTLLFRIKTKNEYLSSQIYANHAKAWKEFCDKNNLAPQAGSTIVRGIQNLFHPIVLFNFSKLVILIIKRRSSFFHISSFLLRKHPLFQSIRALTGILIYCKTSLLPVESQPKILVISSDSDPLNIALLFAYLASCRKVVFCDHALLGPTMTKANYDAAYLKGPYNHAVLLQSGCQIKEIHQKKISLAAEEIKQNEIQSVLIALGKLPNWNTLRNILHNLKANDLINLIRVRPHPTTLSKMSHLKSLKKVYNFDIDLSKNLFNRIDLLVAGNSAIHLEALAQAIPTIYIPDLDNIPFDLYKFKQSDAIFCTDDLQPRKIKDAQQFYSNYDLQKNVSKYFYLEDNEQTP